MIEETINHQKTALINQLILTISVLDQKDQENYRVQLWVW